eukprot:COSAG03_NODE_1566_length_3865_cov_5.286511_1_plen_350_part_00
MAERGRAHHLTMPASPSEQREVHLELQATRLQAWWRMVVLRRAYVEARAQWMQMRAETVAATGPEAAGTAGDPHLNRAATRIQNCWRAYMNTRIFRYYRDLISFRERGMPSQLLRCVNPTEARLLDAATSTHVRFRLGGVSFPPTIYYKVFCHGSLLDIGSFAPRDYTQEGSKRQIPRHSIEPGERLPNTSHDGWYRRKEMNNWRPMSMKLVDEGLDLHLGRAAAAEKSERGFHHSRALRREEREMRKRQRKREWLKKMYRTGMEEATRIAATLHEETGGNGGDFAENDVDEGEGIDELLNWTAQLDYELYFNDWLAVATSGRADRSFFADESFFTDDAAMGEHETFDT